MPLRREARSTAAFPLPVLADEIEALVRGKVVPFLRQARVIEAAARRILNAMPADTAQAGHEAARGGLAKSEKLYGMMYAQLTPDPGRRRHPRQPPQGRLQAAGRGD